MNHAERIVADLLRSTFAPLPDMKVDWNAKAALAVAKLSKDHPRAVIVAFKKRGSN